MYCIAATYTGDAWDRWMTHRQQGSHPLTIINLIQVCFNLITQCTGEKIHLQDFAATYCYNGELQQ